MSGSSLWLALPPSSPLFVALQELIATSIPSIFPQAVVAKFTPHVTLSADNIPPFPQIDNPQDPQSWLNSVSLPASLAQLRIHVQLPHAGNPFFRKLSIQVRKTPELVELAAHSKAAWDHDLHSAQTWAARDNEDGEAPEGGYGPHLSLMYSELSPNDVHAKLEAVTVAVREKREMTPGSASVQGGEIWLVPTEKTVDEWQPIARRRLPETVEWIWET